jgi:hypothetical protein
MKAYLVTYDKEELVDADLIDISKDYIDNPNYDNTRFHIDSNQVILTQEDFCLHSKSQKIKKILNSKNIICS